MRRETKQLIVALIILGLLMILTYFFSPQYKYRKMSKDFKEYTSEDVISDYVGVLNNDYSEKIRGIISKFSSDFKTDFSLLILPETKNYKEDDILNFFFDSKFSKKHFGILILIFPEQGKVNIELDKRLRFVIDEKVVNSIIKDKLLAAFRMAETEYSEKLKDKENINNIESKYISKGIYETIQGIGKEIIKEYPYLEQRIASEQGESTLKTVRNWLGYIIIIIILLFALATYMKKRCPRCHSKMKQVRVSTPTGKSFTLYKCQSCGYIRRRTKSKKG